MPRWNLWLGLLIGPFASTAEARTHTLRYNSDGHLLDPVPVLQAHDRLQIRVQVNQPSEQAQYHYRLRYQCEDSTWHRAESIVRVDEISANGENGNYDVTKKL